MANAGPEKAIAWKDTTKVWSMSTERRHKAKRDQEEAETQVGATRKLVNQYCSAVPQKKLAKK